MIDTVMIKSPLVHDVTITSFAAGLGLSVEPALGLVAITFARPRAAEVVTRVEN
jgi:hypothetical protein